MNRAFFIILFVALLIIPLSINNVNNEGISYFELIAEIGIGMLEDSETEKEINIVVSESQKNKITTACITCNLNTPLSSFSDYPIEVVVGPEFVTGSTRMKAGTAQKLVLNMITTSSMIKIGRVIGNKMVDMQLSNTKLVDRGVKMIINKSSMSYEKAKEILLKNGSVRKALKNLNG